MNVGARPAIGDTPRPLQGPSNKCRATHASPLHTKISMKNPDEKWMQHAITLAERGRGFASPNPIVGACLVRNNRIIAEGFHERFGGPHAEKIVLDHAGKNVRRANTTLYITLEPCSTFGKTPPCTKAILESGIKTVVIGALDPNPKHQGRGVQILKRAGIKVKSGILKEEIEKQIEGFNKWILTGTPFVTLKMAQSIDGKIAAASGDSRWISSPLARDFVHELRSKTDAIIVGKNTVLRDNPRLTVHPSPQPSPLRGEGWVRGKWQPFRFLLDSKGELSPKLKVFHQPGKTILVCGKSHSRKTLKRFARMNVSILPVSEREGKIDLKAFLKEIGSFGVTSVLVEGGGELAASFLEASLVDKAYFMIAPKIIGGRNAKTSVEGEGVRLVRDAANIKINGVFRLEEDVVIEGNLK